MTQQRQAWVQKCNQWKQRWPVMQPEYFNDDDYRLNLYAVLDAINQFSSSEDILMGDAGSISYAGPVALNAKPKQRFIFSPAQADMGWALPASIGVAMASQQQVIAIIGDGSFMTNLQELATVKQHNLNIKFVILNNDGYLSIKNTQTKYFAGRVYGTSAETGLWFPKFKAIADAFEMSYYDMRRVLHLENFKNILEKSGPAIINCQCKLNQEILPAQALRDGRQAGLHDMTPFLPKEEIDREMFVEIK